MNILRQQNGTPYRRRLGTGLITARAFVVAGAAVALQINEEEVRSAAEELVSTENRAIGSPPQSGEQT